MKSPAPDPFGLFVERYLGIRERLPDAAVEHLARIALLRPHGLTADEAIMEGLRRLGIHGEYPASERLRTEYERVVAMWKTLKTK